jgi:hypothetical protein
MEGYLDKHLAQFRVSWSIHLCADVCSLFTKSEQSYNTLFLQLLHVKKAAQNSGDIPTHTHQDSRETRESESGLCILLSPPPSFCLEQAVLLSDAASLSLSLSLRACAA